MKPTIEVYWNEKPTVGSEIRFLEQIKKDLSRRNISALIFANFHTLSKYRQVDFVIITQQHVAHVELKAYQGVLVGGVNGSWSVRRPDGTLVDIERENPCTQAVECKNAFSNDMRAFAKANPEVPRPPTNSGFLSTINSVVCVYPRLAAGSEVPSDFFKVRTCGYEDFVSFIANPGPTPGWSREHWLGLARMLGLTNAESEPTKKEIAATAAKALVLDYSRRLKDSYRGQLHELVPVPLELNSEPFQIDRLFDLLHESRHVQLVGLSGGGKSHQARHLAVNLDENRYVPILVEARMYEGRLKSLLDRGVARFSSSPALPLVDAAAINGQTVVLIMDAFNECRELLKEQLLGDLSAFCLRYPIFTFITSQFEVPTQPAFSGKLLRLGELTDDDRRAVLESYQSADIVSLCAAFRTPYELSIAAECVRELSTNVNRALLFAAFVRKRLESTGRPVVVRDALRHAARQMTDRIVTVLPIDEVAAMLEQYVTECLEPLSVVDDIMACRLVTTLQGRFAFTHEMVQGFLAAESLRANCNDPIMIGEKLRTARYEDLKDFVVGLENDRNRVADLLFQLAGAELFVTALRGDFGSEVLRTVEEMSARVLDLIATDLPGTHYIIHGHMMADIVGGHVITEADKALLYAIGLFLPDRRFLNHVLQILDATDDASRRSLDDVNGEGRRPNIHEVVHATLVSSSSLTAAAILLDASRQGWHNPGLSHRDDHNKLTAEHLSKILDEAQPNSYGRLFLVCHLMSSIDGEKFSDFVPRVLRLCQLSKVNDVQIAGLEMAGWFARMTEGLPIRDEIISVLDGMNTNNIMVSTLLVETLYAYGQIEPPDQVSSITEQIKVVLSDPENKEFRKLAHSIVLNQFEEIVGPPYWDAVQALSDDDRIRLYTTAVMEEKTGDFWCDWLLRELVNSASALALPAFLQWAISIDPQTPFIQSIGSCYTLAMKGCALHLPLPPKLTETPTRAHQAWECFGGLVFWLSRPGIREEEVVAACRPIWARLTDDLLPAAIDPIYLASTPGIHTTESILRPIVHFFPDELRFVAEWSLKNHKQLDSIVRVGSLFLKKSQFIMQVLGMVGNDNTARLLESFVDHPDLGRDAVQTIRELTKRIDTDAR
jgi:hypothetical protein